jgi:hypothetical protein
VTLKVSDIPDTGDPKFEAGEEDPAPQDAGRVVPARDPRISTSAILVDSTRGGSVPSPASCSSAIRAQQDHARALEKVNGVYQGVVFPFREGFMSGVFREAWGKDGSMYVGQTSRGWGATGRAQYGLQRLVWTGKTPFEAHHVSARPDGFEIFFTAPVDRATAENPASWGVNSFIYKYHHIYGSPVINASTHAVRAAIVSKDGRSVRIAVDSLRQWYVHEIRMSGVRAAEGGAPLLHDVGYYTVNQIPAGKVLAVKAAPTRATVTNVVGRHRADARARVESDGDDRVGAECDTCIEHRRQHDVERVAIARDERPRAGQASDVDARRLERQSRSDRERAGGGGDSSSTSPRST